jgi:hypothetical protein
MGAEMTYSLDAIFKGYATCALWSSADQTTESGGHPLDDNFSIDDISDEAKEKIMKDCQDFIDTVDMTNEFLLDGLDLEQIGHDFWLTRNGHGCGFWDGDYEEEIGEKLTKISKEFRECNLIVSNGKIEVF